LGIEIENVRVRDQQGRSVKLCGIDTPSTYEQLNEQEQGIKNVKPYISLQTKVMAKRLADTGNLKRLVAPC
jgi:endonuclease YncB( thermonuclease family)